MPIVENTDSGFKTIWVPFTKVSLGPSLRYVVDRPLFQTLYSTSILQDIYNPWSIMPASLLQSAAMKDKDQFMQDLSSLDNIPEDHKMQMFLSTYAAIQTARKYGIVTPEMLAFDLATVVTRRRKLLEAQKSFEERKRKAMQSFEESVTKKHKNCTTNPCIYCDCEDLQGPFGGPFNVGPISANAAKCCAFAPFCECNVLQLDPMTDIFK